MANYRILGFTNPRIIDPSDYRTLGFTTYNISNIIIGKKYVYTAPRHSTVVHGVTEIRRIGVQHVLLLKSSEHYDSFV